MIMWILILTLITSTGVSIESIEGFGYQRTCEIAGRKYVSDMESALRKVTYQCVQK
jgi:hypothetical protein